MAAQINPNPIQIILSPFCSKHQARFSPCNILQYHCNILIISLFVLFTMPQQKESVSADWGIGLISASHEDDTAIQALQWPRDTCTSLVIIWSLEGVHMGCTQGLFDVVCGPTKIDSPQNWHINITSMSALWMRVSNGVNMMSIWSLLEFNFMWGFVDVGVNFLRSTWSHPEVH